MQIVSIMNRHNYNINLNALRNASKRTLILNELRGRTDHPTAAQVFEGVRSISQGISLTTVYRNLDVLVKTGKAVRIESTGAEVRYDGCVTPHHHLICSTCGAVFDLPEAQTFDIKLPVSDNREFEITGYRLEFTGRCSKCLKTAHCDLMQQKEQ